MGSSTFRSLSCSHLLASVPTLQHPQDVGGVTDLVEVVHGVCQVDAEVLQSLLTTVKYLDTPLERKTINL